MRVFFSLLQSLAGLQDLVPFRLFDNVVLERETQAAESWRIAFGCSQEQLDLINWISDDAVFHTIHRYVSRSNLAKGFLTSISM